MERYLGLDAHARSCTMSVTSPSGKLLRQVVVATTASEIIDAIRGVRGRRHLCIEEGTMSEWLHEILSPHVDELVVMQATEPGRGQKSDARDALMLAEALRTGAIKRRVRKGLGEFKCLRRLSRAHQWITRDVARTKSRLKSLYLSHGLHIEGQGLYASKKRGLWIKQLPRTAHLAAVLMHDHLELQQLSLEDAATELEVELWRHDIAKVLVTTPGFGPIRTARAMSVVISPQRFRTKKQFWSYAGLGLVMRTSSDWAQDRDGKWQRANVDVVRGLNRQSNRILKDVFKGAAITVLRQAEHPLRKNYDRQLAQGTKPNLATLTLARKIAAAFLAMWKTEEVYDSTKNKIQA